MRLSFHNILLFLFTFYCLTALGPASASPERLHIAVASNFTKAAKELVKDFRKQNTNEIVLSFASSGKLFAQIANGAPYDLFLSADRDRIERAIERGLGLERSRLIYARGRLAFLAHTNQAIQGIDDVVQILQHTNRIAIANPKTAPYGRAALSVLKHMHLGKDVETHLIRGENIAQTFQFIASNNVQAAFVAAAQLSDIPSSLKYWIIPETLHPPLDQEAILLRKAEQNPIAQAFLDYLVTPAAQQIILNNGYGVASVSAK